LAGLTLRERFLKICNFEMADRPVRWETLGFWQQTIDRWHNEGTLSENIRLDELRDYFKIEPRPCVPGNTGLTNIPFEPLFEEKELEDLGDIVITQTRFGVKYRTYKDARSMPQWLSFPVKTPEDWQKNVKFRLNPDNHIYDAYDPIEDKMYARYKEEVKKFQDNPEPNGMTLCGVYGFYRNLFGEENLAYALYDYPETIHDMGKTWLEFYATVCEKVIKDCRVDYIIFWEDMACKTGPLLGPHHFKEYMLPYYKEIINHFKSCGVKILMVDSDGNNDANMPFFLEAGVNAFLPFEVAAGNDIREVRQKYPELVIWGGIDKRTLLQDKEAIKREIMEKVPEMWKKGGYIPCLDHSTMPCPQENWEYYLETLRGLFE